MEAGGPAMCLSDPLEPSHSSCFRTGQRPAWDGGGCQCTAWGTMGSASASAGGQGVAWDLHWEWDSVSTAGGGGSSRVRVAFEAL